MRKLKPVVLCCLAFCLSWSYRAAAQCTGANMSNAFNLGTISAGNTYTYTHNNSDPCYGNDMGQTSNDIYYRFTLGSPAQVNMGHCGTAFDTYMWLLDVNGSVIASNDDNGPVCSGTASSISQSLGAGTYYVVSEGYGSNAGNITTQISVPGGSGGSSGWATSGTNLYNTNTGNVGIGTTSPRGVFDVGRDGEVFLASSPNGGSSQSNYLSGHVYLAPHGTADISYLQARRLNNSGSTALRLRTYNNGSLTEAMHIAGNGNVGIGTINPQGRLEVSGNTILNGPVSSSSLNDGSGVARMVTVTNGVLGYQTVPSGGGGAYLPLTGGILTGNTTLNSGYDLVVNGGANSWGGYPGVAYYGGNGQFRYHGTNGALDVYADGNFYATDNNHLVLHAGNYNNFALPLSGGSLTGPLSLNGGKASITTNDDDVLTFNNTDNAWQYIQFNKSGVRKTWLGLNDGNDFYINKDGGGNILLMGGNVGIGTANATDANYKLFVATGIRTPKVKVDPTAWADYVFEDTYRLPTLKEVEQYIQQYKHLPAVPSAAEVQANGLDLGEHQATLLRKIEELTLYILEQNKKLEQLEKEIANLKKK